MYAVFNRLDASEFEASANQQLDKAKMADEERKRQAAGQRECIKDHARSFQYLVLCFTVEISSIQYWAVG